MYTCIHYNSTASEVKEVQSSIQILAIGKESLEIVMWMHTNTLASLCDDGITCCTIKQLFVLLPDCFQPFHHAENGQRMVHNLTRPWPGAHEFCEVVHKLLLAKQPKFSTNCLSRNMHLQVWLLPWLDRWSIWWSNGIALTPLAVLKSGVIMRS